MIPLSIPTIDEKEIDAVSEVLRSGWLIHGPKVKQFEEKFAQFIGVKRAVALNSCTSALQLALQAQDLKGEVILPSFTFVASANAVVNAGCKPVFVDIDYDTCNIDPERIEEKITRDTVAIMSVHYAGQSCQMDRIMEIAKEYNLVIIEDSAEAIGAEFKGKKTGSFGIGCFSFFPTKNMTTGEGGMLTTSDEELAEKVKAYIGHGIQKSTLEREGNLALWRREAVLAGYNFRMTDIQGAIGLTQLSKIEEMNSLRRKHAKYLNDHLSNIKGIQPPCELEECRHVYQMYTIKVNERINRDRFILSLREKGIGASVHFDPPVHLQKFYRKLGYKEGDLPITEKVSSLIVSLPIYPQMSLDDLQKIVCVVQENIQRMIR